MGDQRYVLTSKKPQYPQHHVVYKESLPCDAPPTYRGQLLKYAYKITIGTQRLGAPTKLLRIPIMVIVLQGARGCLASQPEETTTTLAGLSEGCVYSESGELAPSNPFLHTPQRDTPRHTALQIIQESWIHRPHTSQHSQSQSSRTRLSSSPIVVTSIGKDTWTASLDWVE
ncbi:RAB6A-GEF complex partner protein 2 [Chionoecetes opilio]|uniref:RAB6A-GEF complex partner protein 2 n=1 Tax=Chionoecetes opilio TaxID=41210 RepID=A0A8J4Y5J3_CHIOP|nr:RAB6A-GEF complex partner protein 2 [Chionoecetes opilio]